MDIPKNNLKTAAGRKSLGTKFLPNENKKRFDWFDGTMTSFEDCTKYNVDDEDKVKGNQYDSAESPPEAVTKVPLKDYRPSSEVSLSSPKNKKRKFPNIEEILQNLNFDTLSLKFTKLLMFLESDTKELALPFTFKEYEEFFVIIVKDINILKSKIFDACYRHICDNIIKAATGYSLTYVYEFKSEFKKIVMVIRKEKNKMVDQSDEETRSFSREMSFVKVPPRYKRFDPVSVQSTPKKKKVNLQNVLELAGTEQIQLASVVDLNQSLRNKKKNKKQKKAKLKKANAVASNEASAKAANRGSTGDSSSACSSRTTSGDRAQQVANNEMSSNPMKAKTWNEHSRSGSSSRASSWDRSQGFKGQHMPRRTMKASRREDETRKEQLIEALSVPVQSDKAMRMMRGMGWNGGALGARGDGITEPLMPKLDLPRGVGFGHARIPQPEPTPKKLKETIPTTSWVSENSKVLQDSENNMMVKKTKDVQLENPTFDSTMKTDELSKPNVELPTQSKPNVELPEPENSNLVMSQDFSRQEYLRGILELLNSDAAYRTLKYQNVIPVKSRKFVINAVQVINDRKVNYGIFLNEEFSIYTQIHFKCKSSPQIFVDAAFLYDFKTIELQKTQSDRHMPIEPNLPIEPVTPQPDFKIHSPERHTEIITEEEIKYYILSTCSQYGSAKALAQLKFKVLFLLNILNFVKSLNEEVEVTFNKILSGKEQMYIQNVVDEVNMRINFGSSPAETKLCSEINEHIEDAFLGAMFNHKYTVVTLNKYFRFKRLNRPDNVIRKSQTTVNLDIYKSATVSQAQVNICEPTDRENDNKLSENYNVAKNLEIFYENYKKDSETNSTVSENNNKVSENNNYEQVLPTSSAFTRSYDSDESSVEEYNSNNATATVPRLPPGEENVNISNFLYLYDKEKPNSQFSKNVDTIMNENKNYIGNGNVVIDNNDNQIIDMIRDGNFNTTDVNMDETESEIDSDDAEYDLCVEMSVDVGKDEDEVNITEDQRAGLNEQSIEHSDIAATSDGRPVNHHENIGVDNFDEIIDEGFLNAEDSDIKDLNSHSVCLGYILGDKLNDIPEDLNKNKYIKDQNVIMKENVTKMMKVISITDKEDLVKVTNTEDGIVVSKTIEENDDKNVRQKTKKIDNKSDCDRLIEAIVVLSENQCDTESVVLKSGTEINVPNYFQDMDSEIKTVRIVHSCHPLAKITKDKVTEIQKHISNAIMLTIDLPLLKCDGVQNGALVYSCHNKKTYDWLLNTISAANNVKVLNTYGVTKMALKFYCFFDYSSSLYLFKMIELYNRELSTENWVVEKTEKDGDYVIFIVKMDKFSIKFIQESGLSLFAGVDKVQFTPIWE